MVKARNYESFLGQSAHNIIFYFPDITKNVVCIVFINFYFVF